MKVGLERYNQRTKHISVRFHYIRDKVMSNEFSVRYIPSKQQLTDFLTKGLPKRNNLSFYYTVFR